PRTNPRIPKKNPTSASSARRISEYRKLSAPARVDENMNPHSVGNCSHDRRPKTSVTAAENPAPDSIRQPLYQPLNGLARHPGCKRFAPQRAVHLGGEARQRVEQD